MSKGALCDATKCIGCRACQVACKQWNRLPAGETSNSGSLENPPQMNSTTFTRVRFAEVVDQGKFQFVFAKQQCMHCEHPACVEACIVGALVKTPEGAVTYDESKCIGCRYCMVACPFGIPTFEWDKAIPWIRKCTFCADRQSAGLKPACITTCPTGALTFGERSDLLAEAKRRIATSPARYINHVYGEKEAGGTSWLYLSPVPFEKLGFASHMPVPVTVNVQRAMGLVPPALLTVAVAMSGVYWLTKRRNEMSEAARIKKESVEGKLK